MAFFLKTAQRLLETYKLTGNVIICGSLYALGDICQQWLEGQKEHDWVRTRRMGTVGLFLGPCNHYWYKALDTRLPTALTTKNIARKILYDQALFSPFCVLTYFTGMAFLNGESMDKFTNDLKVKFPPTYITDCMVWPVLQVVNFRFVPPLYRVLYVGCGSFFWNTYLSHMKHQYGESPQPGSLISGSNDNKNGGTSDCNSPGKSIVSPSVAPTAVLPAFVASSGNRI